MVGVPVGPCVYHRQDAKAQLRKLATLTSGDGNKLGLYLSVVANQNPAEFQLFTDPGNVVGRDEGRLLDVGGGGIKDVFSSEEKMKALVASIREKVASVNYEEYMMKSKQSAVNAAKKEFFENLDLAKRAGIGGELEDAVLEGLPKYRKEKLARLRAETERDQEKQARLRLAELSGKLLDGGKLTPEEKEELQALRNKK
jgi:hypothetical protein